MQMSLSLPQRAIAVLCAIATVMGEAGISREQFPRSILVVASSPTRATSSRGRYADVGRLPRCGLPRADLIGRSAGGLLRCSAARLSVCRVVL